MFHDPCKYKGLCSHHILLDVWCLYLRSGSIQSCSITPPASSFPSHHSAWSPESLGTIQGDFKVEWRHVCFSLTVTGTAQVCPLVAICVSERVSLLYLKWWAHFESFVFQVAIQGKVREKLHKFINILFLIKRIVKYWNICLLCNANFMPRIV